ncbi:MAG: DUF1428 domain-containing protein [Candidatus Eisenbacteria bacterium]|uniref:DUF1428 domain-containing protein n=1 Tax=Eiseniibacteriota bacterium TaxID=2212470 RepID=A0A849SII8_UNCEI|nr:DUF1428 domain-containing protein [Candidatus Eisenbacteria bacterium]
MPRYVDGFVIPIPKSKLATYRKMAKWGAKTWMKHGALEYFECVGDDLKTPFGLPFPKLAKTKPGETVVFSWIVYKSKAHRDQVNKKVMTEPGMMDMAKSMPFDVKRMSMGGFEVFVEAAAGKRKTAKKAR